MNLELSDQTVLITGASGGIGQALASVFADEGARLVLHAGSRLAELQRWTATQPWADRAHCVAADLRDPDAVDAAFAEGRHRFGRVDAVVANAGVWPAPKFVPRNRFADRRFYQCRLRCPNWWIRSDRTLDPTVSLR